MELSKSLLRSQSISSQIPPLLKLDLAGHGARRLIPMATGSSCFVSLIKSSCSATIGVQTVLTVTQTIKTILAQPNASYDRF